MSIKLSLYNSQRAVKVNVQIDAPVEEGEPGEYVTRVTINGEFPHPIIGESPLESLSNAIVFARTLLGEDQLNP